ncbi:MAG: hypothetical protein HY719_03285 [Planctomycetes bacterium]|nr:hypothetical protein [Planctomycetota bacterium]
MKKLPAFVVPAVVIGALLLASQVAGALLPRPRVTASSRFARELAWSRMEEIGAALLAWRARFGAGPDDIEELARHGLLSREALAHPVTGAYGERAYVHEPGLTGSEPGFVVLLAEREGFAAEPADPPSEARATERAASLRLLARADGAIEFTREPFEENERFPRERRDFGYRVSIAQTLDLRAYPPNAGGQVALETLLADLEDAGSADLRAHAAAALRAFPRAVLDAAGEAGQGASPRDRVLAAAAGESDLPPEARCELGRSLLAMGLVKEGATCLLDLLRPMSPEAEQRQLEATDREWARGWRDGNRPPRAVIVRGAEAPWCRRAAEAIVEAAGRSFDYRPSDAAYQPYKMRVAPGGRWAPSYDPETAVAARARLLRLRRAFAAMEGWAAAVADPRAAGGEPAGGK